MRKILATAFISCFFLGCAVAPFVSPIVTGVIMWVEGEAHKYYEADAEILYRATKRACRDLELEITEDEHESEESRIVAGANNRFKIKIRSVEDGITKVSVRIDFMGDKDYAELLYKKIDENLSVIEFENGQPTQQTRRERRWPTR